MVRNEISVLKRVSSSHRNIVTLRDYFETANNLYLCFDLCAGGGLFDPICAKGKYYESIPPTLYLNRAAPSLPENAADIMIADFGQSHVMDNSTLPMLTETCRTPGVVHKYIAAEVFKKTGHSKPVDIQVMGVIAYFLLCGYTPFDRDNQRQEMEAIIQGNYKLEPIEYWANVPDTAHDFVSVCLPIDPPQRPTNAQCLEHNWLSDEPHFVPDPESVPGQPTDLLLQVQKNFNTKKTCNLDATIGKPVVECRLRVNRAQSGSWHDGDEAYGVGESSEQ